MATAATTIRITTRRLNEVWLCAATSKQVFCQPVVELPDNPEQSKLDDAFPSITTPIPSSIEAAIKIVTNVITTFSILFISTKHLNINTLVINIGMDQRKRWLQENKIHVKACSKKYYQENKEKILQQQKEYRAKNPEKTKKIRADYYQKNREEKKRKQKRTYYINKNKPITELEI